MRILLSLLPAALLLPLSSTPLHADTGYSLGFGSNYWQVIDEIDVQDVDENGFSWLIAYRYDGGLLNVQTELEVFPEDYAGSSKDVYSPKALITLGDRLFAGIGMGIQYADSQWADTPFYFLRAGLSLLQLGPMHIDFHANYLFTNFDQLDTANIDTDTVTLGAMLRFDL